MSETTTTQPAGLSICCDRCHAEIGAPCRMGTGHIRIEAGKRYALTFARKDIVTGARVEETFEATVTWAEPGKGWAGTYFGYVPDGADRHLRCAFGAASASDAGPGRFGFQRAEMLLSRLGA